MDGKNKGAGLWTRAPYEHLHNANLTDRLAGTKVLLVEAYNFGALNLPEAEGIAARLRCRSPYSWRSA